MLEFAGPLVSKRGFDPQYASVFDRYAASTRNLLDMFRFNFNSKFGKDEKPIEFRPATRNTQRVEISIRNATRRKRSGSGPLRDSQGREVRQGQTANDQNASAQAEREEERSRQSKGGQWGSGEKVGDLEEDT